MALVEYEVKDRIAYITLNRPDKLNAMNLEMRREYVQALMRVRDDPDVWVAVLKANGRAFCTGVDLVGEGGYPPEEAGANPDEMYLHQLTIYKPFIAAVHGYCLAQGAGIALCSDLIVAAEDTQFGWPQVKRGISSVSGPSLLAHLVPLRRALEALLLGEFIPAQEALRLDLVNRVVPKEELLPTAEGLARKLLENAPLAVRAMKEAVRRGLEMGLEERIRLSDLLLRKTLATEDAQEGLRAFAEKRPPVWRGR